MAIDKSRIREFPPISITINGDAGGELLIGATRQAVTGTDEIEVRRELLGLVVAHARTGGSPVRVTTRDEEGIGVLLVSPEGEIEEEYSEALEDVMETVPAGAEVPRLASPAAQREEPAASLVARTLSVASVQRTFREEMGSPRTSRTRPRIAASLSGFPASPARPGSVS